MKKIAGYHFTGEKLRNGVDIPKIGEWLQHDGAIIPCNSGLHCSVHPFDALQYAPGVILHKVVLSGDIKSHGMPIDKYVGRERQIVASLDATPLLREFTRYCALSVVHLWDAPDVVLEYLFTGNESLRAAAWAATRAATRAARDDARAAAGAAAGDALVDQREYFLQLVELAFEVDKC